MSTLLEVSSLLTALRIILLVEYFLGGIPRLSSWPLASLHDRIHRKTSLVATRLPPLFRFSTDPFMTRLHMWYVGLLMVTEGTLLGLPQTRGSLSALTLGSLLTGFGFWSQRRANLPHWLPAVNFCLGWVVFLADQQWFVSPARRTVRVC